MTDGEPTTNAPGPQQHDIEPDNKKYDARHLRILQINLNKSAAAQLELMNGKIAKNWDIVLIQEPHRNYYQSIATARGFRQVYPSSKARKENTPRSAIWMNERINTGTWHELNVYDSPDITAVKIQGQFGQLTIFNVYNSCENDDTTDTLQKYIDENQDDIYGEDNKHVMWAGDFNRHHQLWDNDDDDRLFTPQATEAARKLIYMLSEWDMQMALPKGVRTLRHMRSKNESRPDNVFCTDHLMDRIIACNVRLPERCPNTDHYPIATIIDVDKHTNSNAPRPNFKETDWSEYRALLQIKLDAESHTPRITDEATFDLRVTTLTKAIQDTTYQIVPRARPSNYARRWWNKELGEEREKKCRLLAEAEKQRAIPDHPIHAELRAFMDGYAKAILEAKQNHWVGYLTDADMAALWILNGYLRCPTGDGGSVRLPPLEKKEGDKITLVLTNEEKAEVIANTLFTKPPAHQPGPDNQGEEYPTPIEPALPITPKRVKEQIKRLSGHKAPGLDGIPNVILKECADILSPHLAEIFNAVFELDVYHQSWKDSITCVLRKPGRPSYQVPKAYRPIALLSTIGKLLSAIVADDMSRMLNISYLILSPIRLD